MSAEYVSGDAQVIANGTVFSFADNPLDIKLHDVGAKGSVFVFRFSFEKDAKDQSARAIPMAENDSRLYHLRLINYNDQLGMGHLLPREFASNQTGLHLYIVFMIRTWREELSRQITYTIFSRHQPSDKEVCNGKAQ